MRFFLPLALVAALISGSAAFVGLRDPKLQPTAVEDLPWAPEPTHQFSCCTPGRADEANGVKVAISWWADDTCLARECL